MSISDAVDLRAIAEETEGYSGADLQAVLYNAHLDVIHDVLRAEDDRVSESVSDILETGALRITQLGGLTVGAPPSKAEEAALQRRV